MWYTTANQQVGVTMDFLLKISILWLALDAMILATLWYAVYTIQPMAPSWWKSVVCDYAPDSLE